ncbi:MAG: hypothetical protein FWE89_04575 [Syntrophaceae bacterium]|nr:hypothetical protein [Syntrophaceae bacterium]
MKVVIVHGEISADAGKDEQDALVQSEFVAQSLRALGHKPLVLPFSLNLQAVAEALKTLHPDRVFNLVETLSGKGSLAHLAPSLLDSLGIPYTGAGTEAMLTTSNKIFAKQRLKAAALPTPPWLTPDQGEQAGGISGPWLVKSVWEHASIGLDEDSVITSTDRRILLMEMARRTPSLGGHPFAEAYIDGREFNLSLLAGPNGPEVLPPAEIHFGAYPAGKVRVVGYRAKWEEASFEFQHTPRSFSFPEEDRPLLKQLRSLALRCWDLFDLHGYGRVDFRVDWEGRPWILEVNANPCLAPDAGFHAATREAGLLFPESIKRILDDISKT